MRDFDKELAKRLKDPEFRKEYEALEPEYQIVKTMLDLREENDLTQIQLSNITGIDRGDISRLENAEANPTLSILKRIAEAFGLRLQINFTR